jgi:uroporphyrinogen decarboxylase
MTSREIVRKTLAFDHPPRVPRQLWLLPWAMGRYPEELAGIQKRFPDDLINAPPFYRETLRVQGDEYTPGIFVDEWGCRFENRQKGLIGEVKEPLINDWSELDKVRIPRERLSVDVGRVNEFCRSREAFFLSKWCARPFEQLQFIRRSDNLYLDLADRPPELFRLLKRMHAFYCEEMELWAETEVDALVFSDDWGAQHSLLISPGLWREIFKPLYREYVAIAHRRSKYAFMHSDGFIADIIPDLIEIGLDALNSQLFCMDIEGLGARFRGRITFWGEVDRQHLLAQGTEDEIAAAVRRVKLALWEYGGAIAQCEFGAGAKPENVAAVFEAWDKLSGIISI